MREGIQAATTTVDAVFRRGDVSVSPSIPGTCIFRSKFCMTPALLCPLEAAPSDGAVKHESNLHNEAKCTWVEQVYASVILVLWLGL